MDSAFEPTYPRTLSASLGLRALSEASEDVRRLEEELAEARRVRDDLIASLVESTKMKSLCKATGLTRQQIWRIAPGKVSK